MSVALVIPTFNELEGMKAVMPKIKKEWVDQIIIVDGGSTDGTIEYVEQNGYFLLKQKTKGLRYAFIEALDCIRADAMLTFSPDGNCIPEAIPGLIEKFNEGYDMVIASRYAKGAKSYDDDPITSFGNWFFTALINLLHGGKYTDSFGIFRIYKKSLVYELALDKDSAYSTPEKLFHTMIGWEPLLSIRAAKRKKKISEIPADEPARLGGERKLQVLRWGAAYLYQTITEFFIRKF